jgi:transposase
MCPKYLSLVSEVARLKGENEHLKGRVRELERRLKVEVRDAREAPFAENTPSSKLNFKRDSDEGAQSRQGGARPGHEGRGRPKVAAEEADESRHAPAPATCPDCGAPLVIVGAGERVLRDIRPPRFRTVHWSVGRGFCPRCHKSFDGAVPGAMPHFAATNLALARNMCDHYIHHMTVGTVSRRTGMNKSTLLAEEARLASILKPCVPRLRREFLAADVKHADETLWPCNGAHGQYVFGFFTVRVALYRFRMTRKGRVAAAVFGAGKPRGVLVTDRYTGYDKPWVGERQYCYAHLLRLFERLLKNEPDNPEYKAFVPLMAGRLKAAMALRSKGLPPGDFAREAENIKSGIAELVGRSARDPALQNAQDIFRKHPDRMYHWAENPEVPADNNLAERGVRGLVIARKTSFGSQSEKALWVREVNMSVMETLALRCNDPAEQLAKALDIYARTGRKADVRDFLFPKR